MQMFSSWRSVTHGFSEVAQQLIENESMKVMKRAGWREKGEGAEGERQLVLAPLQTSPAGQGAFMC